MKKSAATPPPEPPPAALPAAPPAEDAAPAALIGSPEWKRSRQAQTQAPAPSTTRDPRTLTPSPLLERIPMLNKVGTEEAQIEYDAGLEATRATGRIRVPVRIITGTDVVVDGRHRVEWAMACGLESVPVEEVSEDEGRTIISEEIFARRHMSKSQRAWIHLWFNPAVADGSTSPKKGSSDKNCPSLEDAARSASVSRSLMKSAAALYRLFTTDKRFTSGKNAARARADVEARIWQGDGIAQILGDLQHGPGGPQKDTGPVDAAAAADAMQQETVNKFIAMLAEWDAELLTAKSHTRLPDAALHATTTAATGAAATLAVATMTRPDIADSHKSQILTTLREALEQATTAAKEAGLKVK